MSRRSRRGVMSESFKYELAKDLGFYDTVQKEGWGGIRTKDAGNMVKRAIQIAEQTLARNQGQVAPSASSVQPQAQSNPSAYGYGGFQQATNAYAPVTVPQAYAPAPAADVRYGQAAPSFPYTAGYPMTAASVQTALAAQGTAGAGGALHQGLRHAPSPYGS